MDTKTKETQDPKDKKLHMDHVTRKKEKWSNY